MAQALISAYLHEEPSLDDWDGFRLQLRQAQWLENRYFQNLADIFSKIFGR